MKTLISLLVLDCFILLMFSSVTAQQQLSTDAKNSVFIQQIGSNNTSTAEIFSEQSTIALFQIGAQNTSYLTIAASKMEGAIVQTGINNAVFQINPGYTRNLNTVVYQQGYNQSLLLLGGNSLSDNMKIAMKGTSQTIVVRNFKRQR